MVRHNRSNVLVMPCYNEESRLDRTLVHALASEPNLKVLLVNDGSKDGTAALIEQLAKENNGGIEALQLPKNVGKAEAVRAGMRHAIKRGAEKVGYADADFATSPPDILRLLDALDSMDLGAVLGSRVARLGASIERRPSRHWIARTFALLASQALRVPVYDTQCGAKWFRVNAAFENALVMPFQSNWSFDVELLGRLTGRWGSGPRIKDDDLLEVPVRAWRDVDGSKVNLRGMFRALVDMGWMIVISGRNGQAYTDAIPVVPFRRDHQEVPPHSLWEPSVLSLRPSRAPSADAPTIHTPIPLTPSLPKFPTLKVDIPMELLSMASQGSTFSTECAADWAAKDENAVSPTVSPPTTLAA